MINFHTNDLIPPDPTKTISMDIWPSVPPKGSCESTILPLYNPKLDMSFKCSEMVKQFGTLSCEVGAGHAALANTRVPHRVAGHAALANTRVPHRVAGHAALANTRVPHRAGYMRSR